MVGVLLSILISIFILESAFAIHEYGHLREFRKRAVPIKEFSLGIGPIAYQYQTASFVVSFRLIPIMAYVAPTKEGGNLFEKQGSLSDKIAVYTAGVRNNFLVGLIIVYFLQVLGWTRGNLSTQELVKVAMITPCKVLLRFFAFLINCITWGRVNLTERFLLSTGEIDPPKPVKKFIFWNLALGFLNLAPIPTLDGGHVAQAVLLSVGADAYIPHIPGFVVIVLLATYYMMIANSDMRVLKIDNPKMDQLDLKGTGKRNGLEEAIGAVKKAKAPSW